MQIEFVAVVAAIVFGAVSAILRLPVFVLLIPPAVLAPFVYRGGSTRKRLQKSTRKMPKYAWLGYTIFYFINGAFLALLAYALIVRR